MVVKKVARIGDNCINCGMCYGLCPFGAINEAGDSSGVSDELTVNDEHYFVNIEKCVGCGRCCNGCPVGNIEIVEVNCV